MASTTTLTVGTPGNLSLAEFQAVVQQQEGIIGPLKWLGREGQNNTITLEIGPAPNNRALLETYGGAGPPLKPGHVLICIGESLIESQPAKVAAYRRN